MIFKKIKQEEMNKYRVLIVNNDRLSQKSLYELLSRTGYKVEIADSAKQSLSFIDENIYHVVIADIDKTDGVELLKMLKARSYPGEVVVLTSYGNKDIASDSLKTGAFDYLVKPVEDNEILSTLERALPEESTISRKTIVVKKQSRKNDSYHGLIGKGPKMKDIYSIIDRISNSKATILLRGESGTGKRMIAHAIHKADKRRKDKPFIEISCGALPREIIESELFGHTKGAFTGAINDRKGRFELAHGGTILLDDIDSFSLDLQVKLLRILQEKEFERVGDHRTVKVDVRIVVSTNQDLEKAIVDKRFREDLYYRLNVISIYLPPLRERKEDLPLLVEHFLDSFSRENHKNIETITEEAMKVLTNYNWPGNIRELENIIERAVILNTSGVIDREDLPEIIRDNAVVTKDEAREVLPESLKNALQEPEKVYILRVLNEVGWNKKRAAVKLGVNRTTLYNKLRKYNILSDIAA